MSAPPAWSTEVATPSFVITHEAWYWPACKLNRTAEIIIGLYYEGAGCDYEFSVSWGPCTHGTLRLHDDGFQALTSPAFAGFFASLAEWGRGNGDGHGRDLTIAEVVAILRACGMEDRTERTKPSPKPEREGGGS